MFSKINALLTFLPFLVQHLLMALEELLRIRSDILTSVLAAFLLLIALPSHAGEVALVDEDGNEGEFVLETLLAPGEFPGRVFVHVSTGEEAAYSLDSSLGSSKPSVELHPERLEWLEIAGLELKVEGESLTLKPVLSGVNDDKLDEGFDVRWVFEPLGQRFEGIPHFVIRVIEAQVIATGGGEVLLDWKAESTSHECKLKPKAGHPNCDHVGVGLETKAISVGPKGKLAAIALGGLKPRIEVYNIEKEPKLVWQALFPIGSGGAVETTFSADGEWVVALTGKGEMHRFDASTGGRHMVIPSSGRAARTVPPGRVMAVGGESGEVTFWYLSDGTIFWRLPPREVRGAVDRLAASGDGRRFATLEYDDARTVVRVWEVRKRAMLAEIDVDPYAVVDITLGDDGSNLFVTHEKKGLLTAKVKKNTSLEASGGDTSRCKGRLQWINGPKLLRCSTSTGEIRVDSKGRKKGELKTGIESSDWIFSASSDGRRLAAVGGGHLLTWWTD